MHLPVLKIYKETFSHIFHNKLPWIRVAFSPALLYVIGVCFMAVSYMAAGSKVSLLNILMSDIPKPDQAAQTGALVGIGNLVYFVTSFISTVSFLVKGYRYGVFEEGGDTWWSLNLNMRFVKMILYYILVAILLIAYVLPSAGLVYGAHLFFENYIIDTILGIVLGILGLYIYARLSLTLVLVAVDQLAPLSTSWYLLRKNVWRLLLLFILFGLTIGVLIVIFLGLFLFLSSTIAISDPHLIRSTLPPLLVLFLIFIWFLFWAIPSKALSLVYLTLRRE